MTNKQRLLSLALCATSAPFAGAQGCTQCRDNTAATPLATQRAYRNAIELLGFTGATVFAGTLFIFRKSG